MAQQSNDLKAMMKLAKSYDFNDMHEFFEYIVDSFVNGQPQQAKELFLSMPKEYQSYMLSIGDEIGLTDEYRNKLTEWAINK